MLKKRKLIEETLTAVARLDIAINEDLLRALQASLPKEVESKGTSLDSDYCEVSISNDEVNHLVEILFDVEADYATKGLGVGSDEDERRAREAKNIAKIVNEWNIDSK